jgi:hypothetical protein
MEHLPSLSLPSADQDAVVRLEAYRLAASNWKSLLLKSNARLRAGRYLFGGGGCAATIEVRALIQIVALQAGQRSACRASTKHHEPRQLGVLVTSPQLA